MKFAARVSRSAPKERAAGYEFVVIEQDPPARPGQE